MEKLIELLNEYNYKHSDWKVSGKDKIFFSRKQGYTSEYDELDDKETSAILISKSFGFIKWLVENDKIDFNKVEKKLTFQECLGILVDRGYYINVVLMLLSITDTPIEDLISYLK